MADDDDPAVRDDRDDERFVLQVDGHEAELVYELDGDRLVLIHTEVPEVLEGQGLGGRLVRAALDRARTDGLVIVPWCPYARHWLRHHPDEVGPDGIGTVEIDWKTLPPGKN